jgi:4-hydroxymandelate oxidase
VLLVSNHGGRATETLRATVQALPEVVAEVKGRVPIFVDGGIRRGTDAFKALALGAKAVGIGRPYIWGLGAFGQAGVDRVLEILQGELKLAMGKLRHAKTVRHYAFLRHHTRLESLIGD